MARHRKMQLVPFLLCVLVYVGNGQTLQLEEGQLGPEELCETLTQNPILRNALEESKGRAVACPCTKSIIEKDLSFERENSCYTQFFFTDGVKQMCCYDYYGNLVKNGIHGGYIIDELFETEIRTARRACCVETTNCDAFYSLNPPDDCSRYRHPYSVRSWGDPHITTLDNHNFTFNGHGEYLFLFHNSSEGELQIQTRTGYQTEGVIDATIFVAFVVYVRKGNDTDSISVFLNKTSGISLYDSSGAPIQEQVKQLKLTTIYHQTSDVKVTARNVLPLEIKMSYTVGLGLDIILTPNGQLNGTGLAGNIVEGSFVGRNGTEFKINSTEADLFPYGESWSLKEEESKFNYNLTGGSFEEYNTNHTTPRFLEQLTGNLTALFEGWDENNITLFNKTCFMDWKNEVSTDCLLAIARSGNVGSGNATIHELRNEYKLMRIINNKSPKFTHDMITHLQVNFSDTEPLTIDLSKYVTDPENDTMTFDIDTNIRNATTYSIDPNSGQFSWLVDEQGRSEDFALTFIVRDEYNGSVTQTVSISYCGCETSNDCDYDYTDPKESNDTSTFERFGCSCTGQYSSGRFCENRINPCEITNCTYAGFNITCDENSENDNPCGPCPEGYKRSFLSPQRQQTCEDIDECETPGWCEHTCNNSVGNYKCDCYKGFSLNSTNGKTCIDIDECADGRKTCHNNELCSDPRGNATCVCMAGYSRGDGKQCEKIKGFSYTFTMSLQIRIDPETLETEDFKNQTKQALLNALNKTIELIDIVIRRIYFEEQQETQRKKRDDSSIKKIHIDYVLVTKNQTTYEDLGSNMTAAFNTANITLNNARVIIPEGFAVQKASGGSCTLGNACDGLTAKCADKDGNVTCECEEGFKHTNTSSSYCIDIDECTESDTADRCYGGTCINLYGGWNCSCPVKKSWAKVGKDSYPYQYRCQGNHSYIGNISLFRADTVNKTDDAITSYIRDLFKLWIKNETVNNDTDASLADLYLTTTIFNLNVSSTSFLGKLNGYWYNFSFIISLGESVDISRIDTVFQTANSSGIRPNNTCNNDPNDCKIFKMIFYNDTDETLCHLGNDCDQRSTKCTVSGGKYHCNCRTGFERYDDRSCRDHDECDDDEKFSCPANSTCINQIGNWTCACPEGYTTTYKGYHSVTCADVDECADNTTYLCQQGKCLNTVGSWNCSCPSGFISQRLTQNFYSCIDFNECDDDHNYKCYNGGTCSNLQSGTWTCSCPAGYEPVTIDNKTINCTDIDECADNSTYLCQNGICNDTEGGWNCVCNTGFQSKKEGTEHDKSCIDVDECKENKCNGTCTNTNGSFICDCDDGFNKSTEINGTIVCTDIDECTRKDIADRCYGGTCINLYRGWNCSCPVNTSWAKVGKDSYPYHYRCQGNHSYIGNISLFRAGTVNKTDADITSYIQYLFKLWMNNETVNNDTDTPLTDLYLTTTIFNFNASADFHRLRHYGYWYNFSFILSLGESVNISRVDAVFNTANNNGIRPNTCKAEDDDCKIFKMIFYEDTDETLCHLGNDCDQRSTKCTVSGGKYHCNCRTGFERYDDRSCRDRDECDDDAFSCPENSTCINQIGNWTCVCPKGYMTTYEDYHNVTCADVDECAENTTYLCQQGTCYNTEGSWNCSCDPGFISQKLTEYIYSCIDFNECLDSNYKCNNNGTCVNLQNGTWTCSCPAGYDAVPTDNNTINCTDIDECADNSTYLCQNGICNDTEGGWNCVCNTGFQSKNEGTEHDKSCIDVDECKENKCNGTCTNTNGSFICDCDDGFNKSTEINGTIVCTDIDECSLGDTYTCLGGQCVNHIGAWSCQCGKGYAPKNSSNTTIECHDVDECHDSICLESSCINTNGSFHCNCSDGYQMDNVTENVYQCKDIKECSEEDPKHYCLNGGSCQELEGNWTCDCPEGYTTEFINSTHIDCKDINECSLNSMYSCENGNCSNYPGNWTCECNAGFKLKSKTNTAVICEDINECENNRSTCGGDCVNLPGSWTCSCPDGFNNITKSASDVVCQDRDECDSSSGYHCQNDMGCINTNGSWACNCRDGERLQTVNQTTKICEAGKTYFFHPEVSITTTDPLLQSNKTVLEIVLRKKIKKIFLRVFPDGDLRVGVGALKEVSGKVHTYDAFFWVRAYTVKPRQDVVADWKSIYQECDKRVCTENEGNTKFQITFLEETYKTGLSSDLCSIEGANTCNPISTICSLKDGEIKCLCKEGYEDNPDSLTSCKDVDECEISGQCTPGNCLNTPGGFTCKCPKGLETPVKNSSNITVCTGSNKYTQVSGMTISRALTPAEKDELVTKLEDKIRQEYEAAFGGVTVTVIVTIDEPTTHTRRRRDSQSLKTFKYKLVSTIYSNVSKEDSELVRVFKSVKIKESIENTTKTNITFEPGQWQKATTTTTKEVTTTSPCTKTCEDGCTCVSESGTQKCMCPTQTTQSVKVEAKSDSEVQDLKTILFGTAGGLGFLVLILAVVIALVCRRYSKQQKRKSRKHEHIHLGPMGNDDSNGEVYIGQDYMSTDVDKLSMGTSYSHRFRPGQLPSFQSPPEPRPDYDPPPIYRKPDIHRSVPMNPLYGRSGSPTPDYRDGPLPRTSGSSHDSGMEVSRGSLNFDRRPREPSNRRVHSLYNQSGHM